MSSLKTFEESNYDSSVNIVDPLYAKQKEDVAKMRASLLVCSDSPINIKQTINNVTVLRVYHQISRIIRYTEMCDKIEDKIYESLDRTLNNSNPDSPSTWMLLLDAQERLQKLLIDSHKLLQPYLDLQDFTSMELSQTTEDNNQVASQLDAGARDRLRTQAQKVLMELNTGGGE